MGKKKTKTTQTKRPDSRIPVLSVTAADVEWQFFRSGGAGGQHQNKTSSGARCIHHPSGARGESREERSQLQNKKTAFRRMSESKEFAAWIRRQAGEDVLMATQVERELWPDRTKTEVFENGEWVEK